MDKLLVRRRRGIATCLLFVVLMATPGATVTAKSFWGEMASQFGHYVMGFLFGKAIDGLWEDASEKDIKVLKQRIREFEEHLNEIGTDSQIVQAIVDLEARLDGAMTKLEYFEEVKAVQRTVEARLAALEEGQSENRERIAELEARIEKLERWIERPSPRPPSDGVLERSMDPSPPASLRISGVFPLNYGFGYLKERAPIYMDRDHLLRSLPEAFRGSRLIKTRGEDGSNKNLRVRFQVNVPVRVHVVFDPHNPLPRWLGRFQKLGERLVVDVVGGASASVTYEVFSRRYEAGSIELGPNVEGRAKGLRGMYFVFLQPDF